MYHIFLSTDGHLGCFPTLATLRNASINIECGRYGVTPAIHSYLWRIISSFLLDSWLPIIKTKLTSAIETKNGHTIKFKPRRYKHRHKYFFCFPLSHWPKYLHIVVSHLKPWKWGQHSTMEQRNERYWIPGTMKSH